MRDRLERQRAGFEATQNEQARFLHESPVPDLYQVYDQLINSLKEQIRRIDASIKVIVDNSDELKQTFELITTIKGVGKNGCTPYDCLHS